MNWYRHPRTVDALAASYVMGSMSARARRRFEQVMARQAEVAQAVAYWADKAAPVALSLPPQALPGASWDRLSDALRLDAGARPHAAPAPQRWWQRWFAPIPAGALALGLVAGLSLPLAWQVMHGPTEGTSSMQLPESYVGVLATAQGRPGLIVSSLRRGMVVDLKVVTPVPVPDGHRLHLWRIDKDGVASPLGVLPPLIPGQIAHMRLAEPAEQAFFPAVELAVSAEPDGTTPGTPTQGYLYRGLCGKVWQ